MLKKWKRIKSPLVFFIVTVSFLLMAKVVFLGNFPDFYIYYLAAMKGLHGFDPYQLVPGIAAYIYPPFTLFIFAPFMLFPLEIVGWLWTVLSISFLLLSLYLLYTMLSSLVTKNQFLFLSSLVFLAFPVKFTLGMGQINNLILLLVSFSLYSFTKKRMSLAGFFLGLSLGIKLFPIFLIFYFLIKKDYRLLFSAFLTFIITMTLPYLFFSYQLINQYWTIHIVDVLKSVPREYYNQSFPSFWYRQFGVGDLVMVSKYVLSILWVLVLWIQLSRITLKTKIVLLLEWSSVITLNILLSSIAWQHHYVLIFIPFLFLGGYIINKRKWRFLILLGISYILISVNLPHPYVYPLLIQSHVFEGGLLLWGINYWLLKQYVV